MLAPCKRNSDFINRKPDGFLGQYFSRTGQKNRLPELGSTLLSGTEYSEFSERNHASRRTVLEVMAPRCADTGLIHSPSLRERLPRQRWWSRTHLPVQKTQEMWVRSPGREDSMEEGMATHCSILSWRIPWTEEPGGIESLGSQRVGYSLPACSLAASGKRVLKQIKFQ